MPRTVVSKKPATLAKLTRPRLYAAFPRERLFALLDGYRRCPVIWIAGPPGAGKTTLTATWLDSRKLPGLWYQVDGGDADPATFFYYLREAAAGLAAKRRTPLPLLTPEYLADLPGFSRRWFRELFARLPRPVTIVLDNYQDVAEDSALHRAIEAATNEIPEGANLIVLSRAMPPAPFARLQASERFAAIEWDQLRLTQEEARGMATGKDVLAEEAIDELHQQCDGWAAGFTLMRERTLRTGLVNRVGEAQTMETVFNYFASQVFDDASAENRDILIRTAFLPRVTIAQAEAISGNAEAGKLLEYLCRHHYFTERLGGDKVTYQYHALFRDFLLSQARQSLAHEGCAELARRAGALLDEQGYSDEAIPLYVAATDWDAATRLIRRQAARLIGHGRGQTLRDWIGALPQKHVQTSPWLLYWFGMSLIQIAPLEARSHLERAFDKLAAESDPVGQALAIAGIVQTYYFEGKDFSPLDRWIPALERLLGDHVVFPSADDELRAYTGMLMAISYRSFMHPFLQPCIDKITALLQLEPDVNQKTIAGFFLLTQHLWVGDFDQAQRVIALTEHLIKEPEVTILSKTLWLGRVGYHWTMYGAHERAAAYFVQSEQLVTSAELAVGLPLLYFFQSHIASHAGDVDMVERLITHFEFAIKAARRLDHAYLHVMKASLGVLRGESAAAVREMRLAIAIADEVGFTFLRSGFRLALAHALTDAGEAEQAAHAVRDARAAHARAPSASLDWWLMLVEAYLALRRNDLAECHEKLRQALRLARQTPYYFSPLPAVRLLPRLFAEALTAGIEVEYAKTFIRGFRVLPPSRDIENWPWPVKVHTLAGFRLELDGKPYEAGRKAPKKPLDLLKALVACGGRNVAAETLANALWPDAEADAAESAMAVTLLRLRKLVGDEEAIMLRDGKLTLDDHRVWVDVWSLERQLDTLEKTLRDAAKADAELGKIGQQVLALYPGHFLAADVDQPWMLPLRERLRTRVLRLTLALGRRLEEAQRWDEAQSLYQRGIELDNLAEEFYRRLMTCHRERGEQAEALNVYRRCRDMLSVVLGVKPSAETEAMRRSVTAE